jgi:hypothetical protein
MLLQYTNNKCIFLSAMNLQAICIHRLLEPPHLPTSTHNSITYVT